jgi:hypothetical protein
MSLEINQPKRLDQTIWQQLTARRIVTQANPRRKMAG